MPYALKRPRLHYERCGRGEPMLFITGFTISAAIFEPLLPLYAQRFECVTYDNRGSGRSGAPLRPTSMPELAADASRLLDALGLASAHVYGVSMGGMIAQELAISFPERVRGLILGCSWPGGPRSVRPALRELGRSLSPAVPFSPPPCSRRSFAAASPSAWPSCSSSSRATGPRSVGRQLNGGPLSITTPSRAWAESGRPRW